MKLFRERCPEHRYGGGNILLQKHLKTNSEWPQSGPVIPLSSKKRLFILGKSKKGGTAVKNFSSSLMICCDHRDGLFIFTEKRTVKRMSYYILQKGRSEYDYHIKRWEYKRI